jgi:hypothetical protein
VDAAFGFLDATAEEGFGLVSIVGASCLAVELAVEIELDEPVLTALELEERASADGGHERLPGAGLRERVGRGTEPGRPTSIDSFYELRGDIATAFWSM